MYVNTEGCLPLCGLFSAASLLNAHERDFFAAELSHLFPGCLSHTHTHTDISSAAEMRPTGRLVVLFCCHLTHFIFHDICRKWNRTNIQSILLHKLTGWRSTQDGFHKSSKNQRKYLRQQHLAVTQAVTVKQLLSNRLNSSTVDYTHLKQKGFAQKMYLYHI